MLTSLKLEGYPLTRRWPKAHVQRPAKDRLLIEFPSALIERADQEALRANTSRSQLIRDAVEEHLAAREKARMDAELAEAYAANSGRNLQLLDEFSAVDREIFQ